MYGVKMADIEKQNLKSEIEYIKEMAQNGDKKPVPFAKIIFLSGIAWLFYYLFWDIVFFKSKLYLHTLKDEPGFGKLYNPYVAAFGNNLHLIFLTIFASIIIIFRKYFFSAGQKSTANRTILSVWTGVLIFLFTRDLSHNWMMENPNFLKQISEHMGGFRPEQWVEPNQLYIQMMTAEFDCTQVTRLISIFSLAWWVCADMSKYKWLKIFAIAGFFSFPLMEKYRTEIMFTPLYSVNFAIVFFVILPSALMLYFEKKNRIVKA